MTIEAPSTPLQVIKDNKPATIEVGTPAVNFFYFRKKSFEILDEEILQIISKDPSLEFLYNDEEDIYSLGDGKPL